jgi:hypothetical protein
MTDALSTSSKLQADKPTQLDFGERLFLWGFRAIAQHHQSDHPVVPTIRDHYEQFGIADAAVLIHAMVDAFFHTAHAPIAIHSACCPCVSDEEAVLLRAMAAAQRGDIDAAREQFGRWLPETAAEWIAVPVSEVGRLFHAAGLSLGARSVDGSKMAQTAAQSWPAGSRTVH